MNNVVKNSKTSPKKSVTAKQLAKSNLTKRKNPDWDNLDRGYRYLTLDMKLPHDLAIAVMGNVVEESLGDYKSVLKNGGGRGLIQWDGKKAPNGRYSLWGSIWASVAKPANVYDSTTDTVKNYWAPWGGLKGDKVRLKFIKAPLKEKAKIYAESYLRPGKPRIADRQLSTMQLDSIYNPRIKDVIVLKDGGKMNVLEFLKNGSGIHIKKKNRGKFTSYCGGKVTDECIRKAKASGNPTLVKRATFAANARKWKHLLGGNIVVVTPEMIKNHYQGEITLGKTFKDRVFDVGNALGLFIPFIGTALDTKENQAYAAASGGIRDIAIPGFIKWGNSKDTSKRIRGWDRRRKRNPNYGKPILPTRFMRGAAKTLGVAGLILDTPNIVSDIENLKRTLGFNYNHLLLMKEKKGGIIKAANGAKTNILLKIGNSEWGQLAINIGSSYLLNKALNKQIDYNLEMSDASLDMEKNELKKLVPYQALLMAQLMLGPINPENPNELGGVFAEVIPAKLRDLLNGQIDLEYANKKSLNKVQALLLKNQNNSNFILGIGLNLGSILLNINFSKKSNNLTVSIEQPVANNFLSGYNQFTLKPDYSNMLLQ